MKRIVFFLIVALNSVYPHEGESFHFHPHANDIFVLILILIAIVGIYYFRKMMKVK